VGCAEAATRRGSLPWGYIKGEDSIAVPDPAKAPFVRRMFELYAGGQHTDRTLAEWLNVHDQRTNRGRRFGVDTVREMLCNAAYAGYVSARRDRSKAIKGLHEPLIDESLFDHVQQLRRQRAHTLKPGRPSPRYLLRGLARCRRCHAKMQGTTGGRRLTARYYCSSRRADRSCDQPIIPAEWVEQQLVQFIAGFAPGPGLREEILRRLATAPTKETSNLVKRRAALEERLRRLRDLYELGDLTRAEYLPRRQAIHGELDALSPDPIPDLNQARAVLEDFTIFWNAEPHPDARRQSLA
jgi:hypothetical protein